MGKDVPSPACTCCKLVWVVPTPEATWDLDFDLKEQSLVGRQEPPAAVNRTKGAGKLALWQEGEEWCLVNLGGTQQPQRGIGVGGLRVNQLRRGYPGHQEHPREESDPCRL